jgi:hypothetical protein
MLKTIWNGLRLSGICNSQGSGRSMFRNLQERVVMNVVQWKFQIQPSFVSARCISSSRKVNLDPGSGEGKVTLVATYETILTEFNDKKIPYDEQMKAFSAQGNSKSYVLCAEKMISSLHRPHNQKKYSQYLTPDFFLHLMTLAPSEDKIVEYYRIMTKELNLIPNKEIFYLIIPLQVRYQKQIPDAIHLLKKEIFRKISYLPKNETESNQLFLSFFEEYRQGNQIQSAIELYNLLQEQESIHSTTLLTDDIYSTLLQTMTHSLSHTTTRGHKFEIIDHWISHYRQQSLPSPSNPTSAPSAAAVSVKGGGYEYFANDSFDRSLQQYLNHFVLKNRSLSLYETYSLGYEFCDLLLSNRIPAYLPILDYLSWLIDNMALRLQSFVKLVFKYETNDILLFEVLPRSPHSPISSLLLLSLKSAAEDL